jgi:hypothetical protein
LAQWTPAALSQNHGGAQIVALMDLPNEGVLFPQDQTRYERALSLAEFLDHMESTPIDRPCYLAYQRAADLFDVSACRFDEFDLAGGYSTDTRVWIGSAGTRSMLHSDLKDNLYCQIWGEKQVMLLGWQDSDGVYPFPDNLVNSRVDLASPDTGRYPRLRRKTFLRCTLRAGDLLYIPRGCWHDIRSVTPSVSVSYFYGPPRRAVDYLRLLWRLGPYYWLPTARDFVLEGVLDRRKGVRFFFSPPSTGKRLYDAIRFRDFSRDNDPAEQG